MKFIVLIALFAAVSAMPTDDKYVKVESSPVYKTPASTPAASTVYVAPIEEVPRPYSFSYNVVDEETYNDFDHSEKTDGKVTTGSYRVELPDGRTQIVTYRADENGYTANVNYEGEAQYPEYVKTKK